MGIVPSTILEIVLFGSKIFININRLILCSRRYHNSPLLLIEWSSQLKSWRKYSSHSVPRMWVEWIKYSSYFWWSSSFVYPSNSSLKLNSIMIRDPSRGVQRLSRNILIHFGSLSMIPILSTWRLNENKLRVRTSSVVRRSSRPWRMLPNRTYSRCSSRRTLKPRKMMSYDTRRGYRIGSRKNTTKSCRHTTPPKRTKTSTHNS